MIFFSGAEKMARVGSAYRAILQDNQVELKTWNQHRHSQLHIERIQKVFKVLSKFGTSRSLPTIGSLSKVTGEGRRPRTQWCLCQSSRVPLWREENLPERPTSLHHSTNRALMVEWPDESQRLNKSHRVACLEFAYSHIKDSWTRGNKMLRSDETKIQLFGMFGGNQTQIICRPVPSL